MSQEEEVKRGVSPPLSCPTCPSWALGNQGARKRGCTTNRPAEGTAGSGTPNRDAAAPITHLRPILGVKGGVGFSRDLWRERQLSATRCGPAPKAPVGGALPSPAHLVERLEAEEEADWWRRAASAAASMSTSLRERGTFSAFRDRFISSRPFRLSERPRRISERELDGTGRDRGVSHPTGSDLLLPPRARLGTGGLGAKHQTQRAQTPCGRRRSVTNRFYHRLLPLPSLA